MTVQVRYFASLKEKIGRSQDEVSLENGMTVKDVWIKANGAEAMPENVLAALNMDYVGFDAKVQDGDEIAFFPPVTGG